MATPPKHGDIRVATLSLRHAKRHLAAMTASMAQVKDYGAHGIGESGAGDFTGSGMSGGASGNADYTTTSTGNTGDADSGNPSGY